MKQKRQQFHKQIRRQALQKIFKQKRQQLILSNNTQIHQSTTSQYFNEQLTLQCKNQLARYGQELNESLINENIQNIFSTIKDSYYEIKKILNKSKQSAQIQNCISDSWFKNGFDKLLINVVSMFQRINKNSFSAIRKQIYRFAVMHFYTVLRLNIPIGAQLNLKEIFNFLFFTIVELSNLPESINQIILTVNYLLNESKQARHQFLFQNYKLQNQNNGQLLSFENLVFIMFQNREKFSQSNYKSQEECQIYREIKMNFICIFKEYGYELKEMEKYIENCRKTSLKKNNSDVVDKTYQQTLRLHGYPPQVRLKHFLQKETLTIVAEIINQMREYYLDNWSQKGQNQQYLADCIEATRLIIDYTHKMKIIQSMEDQLGDIINLLTINNMNIHVKNQTIFLIDSIVYFDQHNIITDFMVRNYNLFEKLWSYQQPSAFSVKMNAVNNLILSTPGFHAINKHLSEIVITLHGTTKFISLALTFINNYFIQTKYDLYPTTRVDLLIQLLYSLPRQEYTVENIELEFYILSHLYDNGFNKQLPSKYEEWNMKLESIKNSEKHQRQEVDPFFQIINKILDIYSHYYKQSHPLEMQNQ